VDLPAPEPVVVAEPVVMSFGEVGHRFGSGVVVSVEADRYDPKASYPGEPGPFAVLRVTALNESGGVVRPDGIRSVTSAGVPVSVVYLSGEEGLQQDVTQVLPGDTQVYDRVLPVPDVAAELVVVVADPAGLDGSGGPLEEVFFRGRPG